MSTPFCKHLRTKKMFTGSTVEEAFADKQDDNITPCHYWCNRTQTVVGVDDQPVHKSTCQAGRSCYEDWSAPAQDILDKQITRGVKSGDDTSLS